MVGRVTVSGEIHSVFKARVNVQGVVVAPSALEATSTRAETIQVQASSAAASDNPCQPEKLPFSLIHQPCLGMHAQFHKTLRLPSRRLFGYGLYNQYGISYRRFHSVLASRSYDVSHPPVIYVYEQADNHQEAVGLLNTLQTPFVVLKKQIEAGIKPDETTNEEMRKYLDKIGYSVHYNPHPMAEAADVPCSNKIWTNSISFTLPGLRVKAQLAPSWTQSCHNTASHMISLEMSVFSRPHISLRFGNAFGSTRFLYPEIYLPNTSLRYGISSKRPQRNQKSPL